jgi:hypothetical protein
LDRLPPINDYEKSVLNNVEKFGWHCTSVTPKNDGECKFSYTVGLFQNYGQPEFIIFGLDSKISHSILTVLAEAAISGNMFPLDKPCSELIDNYDCAFVGVPKEQFNNYVFSALWFNAGDEFPLTQVVWPDSDGCYPWHEETSKGYLKQQPVLALIKDS